MDDYDIQRRWLKYIRRHEVNVFNARSYDNDHIQRR